MSGWYVVNTHAHQEARAQANLERQGFRAWAPTMRRSRRHARRIDTVESPMFPGYVFVSFDPDSDRWSSINGTFGVRRLLCAGDRPQRVPDDFVSALHTTLDERGVAAVHDGWMRPGATVRIVEGPFVDNVGTLVYLAAKDRVALLLQVLSRDVVALVSRRAVVPAA